MPKKTLPKKRIKRQVRKRVRLDKGRVRERVIFLVGIILLLAGLFYFKPWQIVQEKFMVAKAEPITMPEPESKSIQNLTIEPDKSKTVFLKLANGTTVSIYIPKGAVSSKRPLSIASAKSETGVILRPEGTNFVRPVSITFDLTKSPLKGDAPDKIDPDNPRVTGNTHLYSVNSKGTATPVLIARGLETSVLVSGRTLSTGAFVLRTNDKGAETYARATLKDTKADFFSTLEASAILLGDKQSLSKEEQATAKSAVEKVLKKKSAPLFELYAAMAVKNYLEGKNLSFVPLAFAAEDLEDQLRKTCTEETHTTETYVNAELVAKMQGFTSVAQLCRTTGDKVLRVNAQKLFNDPNASFEEVMVMIGQVKSIEGTNSTLLTNMENKLEQVVDRDIRDIVNNRSASLEDIQEIWMRKAFTFVDPALSKELDRVTFMEAREQIEKILADNCPKPSEVLYAKSLVIQYQLDDLKDKVNNKNECSAKGFSSPGGGNPPPPPPGGGGSTTSNSLPPEQPGTCYDPFQWSYNMDSDDMCEVCYDILTNDQRLDYIETKCVKYACEFDTSMWYKLEEKKCKMYDIDIYSGKHTDPDWQPLSDDLPLEPLPPADPEIPDSLDASGGDNASNDGGSSDGGSSSDEGGSSDSENSGDDGSAPQNPYDIGL